MKSLAAITLLALCAGCSTSSITNGQFTARNTRFFWTSTDFTGEVATNGTVKITLKASSTHVEALSAVAEATARGVAQGLAK